MASCGPSRAKLRAGGAPWRTIKRGAPEPRRFVVARRDHALAVGRGCAARASAVWRCASSADGERVLTASEDGAALGRRGGRASAPRARRRLRARCRPISRASRTASRDGRLWGGAVSCVSCVDARPEVRSHPTTGSAHAWGPGRRRLSGGEGRYLGGVLAGRFAAAASAPPATVQGRPAVPVDAVGSCGPTHADEAAARTLSRGPLPHGLRGLTHADAD
jgi:hypothetical protein